MNFDILFESGSIIINVEAQTATNVISNKRNNDHFHRLAINYEKLCQIIINYNKVYGEDIYTVFTLKSDDFKYEKDKDKKVIEIGLPNVLKKYYNKDKLSEFEKILLLLVIDNKKELYDIAGENRRLKKMADKISKMSKNDDFMGVYNAIDRSYENGWGDGVDTGKTTGSQEKQKEIAKNLLQENLDIDLIIKTTGLSKEEVLALKS